MSEFEHDLDLHLCEVNDVVHDESETEILCKRQKIDNNENEKNINEKEFDWSWLQTECFGEFVLFLNISVRWYFMLYMLCSTFMVTRAKMVP